MPDQNWVFFVRAERANKEKYGRPNHESMVDISEGPTASLAILRDCITWIYAQPNSHASRRRKTRNPSSIQRFPTLLAFEYKRRISTMVSFTIKIRGRTFSHRRQKEKKMEVYHSREIYTCHPSRIPRILLQQTEVDPPQKIIMMII